MLFLLHRLSIFDVERNSAFALIVLAEFLLCLIDLEKNIFEICSGHIHVIIFEPNFVYVDRQSYETSAHTHKIKETKTRNIADFDHEVLYIFCKSFIASAALSPISNLFRYT